MNRRIAVLMPPDVQVRRIELPRMSAGDARRVVERNVAKYFPDATGPMCIAVERVRGSHTAWIAAAVPAAALACAYQSGGADAEVDAAIPAQASWAVAAGEGAVLVHHADIAWRIEAASGQLTAVRRAPAALAHTLGPARVLARTDDEALRAAILNAHRVRSLHLVPEAVRRQRAQGAARISRFAAVTAAALLVMSAGVNLWGERRELDVLRERRASHADAVRQALALQETLLGAADRVNAIAQADAAAERWSAVVAQVAGALPPDAHLTAFRAEADSVSLAGQATNAAGVFAAMRMAPGIVAVRATAPVRQEGTGDAVVERFLLGARVDPRAALGNGGHTP